MAGSREPFADRVNILQDRIGHGRMVGQVEVDQVYAAVQEAGGWLNFMGQYGPKEIRNHPGGGTSPALGPTLHDGATRYMLHLADGVRDGRESGLLDAMVENVEDISDRYRAVAPHEFGGLSESGHPTVTDDGAVVYDRPPEVGRLSPETLKAKGNARGRKQIRSTARPDGSLTFSKVRDYHRTYLPPEHPRHGTASRFTPQTRPAPAVDRRRATSASERDRARRMFRNNRYEDTKFRVGREQRAVTEKAARKVANRGWVDIEDL